MNFYDNEQFHQILENKTPDQVYQQVRSKVAGLQTNDSWLLFVLQPFVLLLLVGKETIGFYICTQTEIDHENWRWFLFALVQGEVRGSF